MTPMDVVALLHPGIKQLSVGRREGQWRPLPNTHKAILDTLYRAQYLQHLNISGVFSTISSTMSKKSSSLLSRFGSHLSQE